MCLSSLCKALKISGTKDDRVLLACYGLILQNAKPLQCLRMFAKACIIWFQGKMTMTRLPILCAYFAGRNHGQTRVGQIWRYHSLTSSLPLRLGNFRALQSLNGLLQWHPPFAPLGILPGDCTLVTYKSVGYPSTIQSIFNRIQFFIPSLPHKVGH